MKKIMFLEISDWEKEALQKHPEFLQQADFSAEKLNKENAAKFKDYEIISVFIESDATAEVLSHLPNLKFIATRSTGFDHIDLDYCRQRQISIANVPAYGNHTVAEYTFALLLCLMRKVDVAYRRLRESGSFSLEGLRGQELFGKTMGVIGVGRIGAEVIKIARGFSMNVLAYDIRANEELADQWHFQYVELEDLLSRADIITLHLPYNSETRHLLNKNNLALVKKGAYLINTARGGLIETEALYQSLKSGQIAGAALDVLEEEGDLKEEQRILWEKEEMPPAKLKTLLANHIFIDWDNVIITGHNAFNTHEALLNIIETTRENIEAYEQGKPMNLV